MWRTLSVLFDMVSLALPLHLLESSPTWRFSSLLFTFSCVRTEGGFRTLNQFWIFFSFIAQQAPTLFGIIITAIIKLCCLLPTLRAQKLSKRCFLILHSALWLHLSHSDDLFSLCGNFCLPNLENGDMKDGAAAGGDTTFDQKENTFQRGGWEGSSSFTCLLVGFLGQ